MHEVEQKVWEQHDRRLNEHELRFNQGTKDFTEIKDQLKQLMERINEGVSKTQNRILEENKTIEFAMKDLKHAVELNTEKMNNKVDLVEDRLVKRVGSLESSYQQISKIYVWAIVSGVVGGLVIWGTKEMLDKFKKNTADSTVQIQNLTSKPIRER